MKHLTSASSHSTEAPGTEREAWTRRAVLASGLSIASGWAMPARAASESEPIRVGLISPLTGFLSAFGAADVYVQKLLAPRLAAGIEGAFAGKRSIRLELFDAASSTDKARETAARLVASGMHMLLATGTPEICNPVADVCEAAGVPCISTVAPWQAWMFGRKGTPSAGFQWTYHFFAGMEEFAEVYASLFRHSGLSGPVGGLWGDDLDAAAFLNAFPRAMSRYSMTLFDAGRVSLAAPDFSPVVRKLREANIQIVTGNLPPPVALDFFAAARRADYKPRMASIAKAFIFPETVAAAAQAGMALTNEVWWSPAWPFASEFTGVSAQQLCADYERATGAPWVQPLGFSHALIDVVVEAVRQAPALTRAGLRDGIAAMKAKTVVGVISFKSRHPALNVCTTPAVGGQWQRQANGRWTLQVVDNTRSPFIPVTAQLTT